jgi:putative ABC transport system permease protein
MVLRKLVISNVAARKVRVALTVAAVALSVSLVVSVTGGLRSGKAAAYEFLAFVFGSVDAQVVRAADPKRGIDESLVDQLRDDADVRRAWGRLESESLVLGADGNVAPGRPIALFGVSADEDDAPQRLKIIEGRWFEPGERDVAVIDQGTRKRFGLRPGDTLTLPGTTDRLALEVVGVVHKPGILAAHVQSAYVPLATLQPFQYGPENPARVSKVNVEFQPHVDAAAFIARWGDRLRGVDPMLKLSLTRDTRAEMDKNLQGLEVLSYLGGAVTMLAATFIVFSTLAMGVAERQRTLAMLRAIGAARGQVGRLVVLEGVLLSVLGVAIGVPLGWLWVWILTRWFHEVFTAGVVLDTVGVLLASVGSVVAAVLASLLPAWNAMRVDPLSAMSPLAIAPSRRPPIGWAVLGVLLASIDPVLLFAPIDAWLTTAGLGSVAAHAPQIRFVGHFVGGLPGIMFGFFLLAPLFVWVLERVLGPVVAAVLRIDYALLRQQLSAGVWRAAGTCAALMVGLAVLVVMQTQGHTALSSWKLPDRFPDVFVYTTNLRGLDPAAQEAIRRAPGIQPDDTMPIAIFSPTLVGQLTGIAGAALMPDATMFFGVDPDKAFDLMELDFRQGTPEEATRLLKQGRHLVITEEFHKLKGLGVGDQFELISATKGKLSYTIAGVVWSPGLDVMASAFDLGRQFEQRTAASVFGSLEDARRDFGVESVYLMAANLELGTDKKVVIERLQAELGDKGINVADVRHLKHDIQQGLRRLLLMSTTVAWAALAVASLGVTNTIMASVRSRRWHLGVLRSIGVTRSMLARMILGEALLIGLIGCALGLGAGMEMSFNARRLSELVIGHSPPIAVPWGIVLTGAGVVMLITLGASLWPAISAARAEPLKLLQAGRASA